MHTFSHLLQVFAARIRPSLDGNFGKIPASARTDVVNMFTLLATLANPGTGSFNLQAAPATSKQPMDLQKPLCTNEFDDTAKCLESKQRVDLQKPQYAKELEVTAKRDVSKLSVDSQKPLYTNEIDETAACRDS